MGGYFNVLVQFELLIERQKRDRERERKRGYEKKKVVQPTNVLGSMANISQSESKNGLLSPLV